MYTLSCGLFCANLRCESVSPFLSFPPLAASSLLLPTFCSLMLRQQVDSFPVFFSSCAVAVAAPLDGLLCMNLRCAAASLVTSSLFHSFSLLPFFFFLSFIPLRGCRSTAAALFAFSISGVSSHYERRRTLHPNRSASLKFQRRVIAR